jgi:hypothetical protein
VLSDEKSCLNSCCFTGRMAASYSVMPTAMLYAKYLSYHALLWLLLLHPQQQPAVHKLPAQHEVQGGCQVQGSHSMETTHVGGCVCVKQYSNQPAVATEGHGAPHML